MISARRWLAGPPSLPFVAPPPPTARRARRSPRRWRSTPADKVWAIVKDFDALQNWHPAIAEPGRQGQRGRLGAPCSRGGGALTETLEAYDAAKMRYSYRAKDGGALPVTNYTSTITVRAEGGKAVVEWRGAFYRGYPNNDPPPDQNDEAAVAASPASTRPAWRT